MDYKPSELVVRIVHFNKGEPSLRSSLALGCDKQDELRQHVHSIASNTLTTAGLNPKPGYQSEIVLGATANKMERQEDLLNDCRNLLIDLENLAMPQEIRQIYDGIMADLDEEIG